ncbi:unnamed protein product [Sphacelaria rigidula]
MQKKVKKIKKINIKIGEKVKVISGHDKGKDGIVKKILKSKNQVIIEGINIKVKHIKAQRSGETGEIKRIEFPINRSNVLGYKE